MSAFYAIKPRSSGIRPWPYPYRGGMAISNDAEFMSFDFFKTMISFLNGTTETAWGNGLGLNITSSVFFYSPHAYNFSYFAGKDVDAPVSAEADEIAHYIENGTIDTIHAYGDFDHVGGCVRKHAENIFSALKMRGLSISIFTNHGGPENIQNVGTDADYHQGDRQGSAAYHADLMRESGIRYLWTDSMVTAANGPNERLTLRACIHRLKRLVKRMITGRCDQATRDLVHDVTLQDGSVFKGFMRFRSTGQNAPNLSSLKHQVDQIEWDDFYQNASGVVLYQHLGILHRIGGQCFPASIEDVAKRKELYLSPFYRIKEERDAGRLWAPRLIDFLDYVAMVEHVSVTSDAQGMYTICANDNVRLAGLTLYVDTTRPPTVRRNGHDLSYQVNGPDETGRYSVTIKDE